MLAERERACVLDLAGQMFGDFSATAISDGRDEAVLCTRCQARAYTDAILRVCRLCAESPLSFGASDRRGFEKTESRKS